MLVLGTVVGSYQIIRKLGEGGMGVVYLGEHTLLGRRAAIKVLLPELSARQDIVNRFFNEARAVTTISDPGIVQVFDFGYHADGSAYIVMEFLEGEALDRRLARLGRLPVVDALRLCRQVASSLAAAHAQRIIHRDLKPENIFLVPDSEVASGERSKILDFGIAKLSDDHPGKIKTHTGALMGSPLYMSPEQCRGLSELDHRSDIYALGCVLCHLLTGRPPFDGEGMGDLIAKHILAPAPAPSSQLPGLPPSVDALVLRCLAKSPAERYSSMTELAAAISQILPYVASSEAPTQRVHAYPGEMTPAPRFPSPVPAAYPTPTPPGASPHLMPVMPAMPAMSPMADVPGTPLPAMPHVGPSRGSYPGTPVPPVGASHGSYPGTPRAPVSSQPTTLGASAGQLPLPSPRKARWWIAGVAALGVAGAGAAAVVTRSRATQAPAAPDGGAGSATPVTSDAPRAATSFDAGVASEPPAAPAEVSPPANPVDAAPPDTRPDAQPDAPVDAGPRRRPPRPPPSTQRPGASTPPACDRSVDVDCDGIPDVR